MMGLLMMVAKHPELAGNSAILSTKASFISEASWIAYFELLKQLLLVLGVMGPGIVIIWIFGREYSDRVIKDILSLPVSRTIIVTAKFIVGFIWSILLLAFLFGIGILSGVAIGLEGWAPELFTSTLKIVSICSLLSVALFTPAALVTCISRGYLLPVGVLILIVMITQFIFAGFPGVTPYFPWAVPAIYSGITGPHSPEPGILSLIILSITVLAGFSGTALWWRHADQH
jgi:ABC-2 type transport system permease protein